MALEPWIRDRLRGKPLLLMAHAVAGYPSLDANRAMLECMEEAGVDLVELQLPFSEPIADGPAFVKANQDAIDAGVRRHAYFALLGWAAGRLSCPVLYMGYYNSVYRLGEGAFCERLAGAGAKGFIVADLPPEEGRTLFERGRAEGLDPILIMTPTSADERLAEIGRQASGFVYCVARKGVTGKQTDVSAGVAEFLSRARRATPLPLGLGFGLKTPDDVRRVRGLADIAIVGTACLEAWQRGGRTGYRRFLRDLVAATR
jgi:tryptophan synthase alpha chain